MRSSLVAAPRKLHLGDGKLGAVAIGGTVWESLSSSSTCVGQVGALDTDELHRLFDVAERCSDGATTRRSTLGSGPSRVQLLDPKQSHLKAIAIHALAATVAPPDEPRGSVQGGLAGTRAVDAEVVGALRIVAALAAGDASLFKGDALFTLAELLPSEDDVAKVREYGGPRDTLGVVEQFTLAIDDVPYYRERARAMLTRSSFIERDATLRATLGKVHTAVASVRASATGGCLGVLLLHALRLIQFLNADEVTTRGFRLTALAKLGGYTSADKTVNLIQLLARSLAPPSMADLDQLDAHLRVSGRVVWADVGAEVELARSELEELRNLARTIRDGAAASSSASTSALSSLAIFSTELGTFCTGEAQRMVDSLWEQHRDLNDALRQLLRWLAVEERLWMRPEEPLRELHVFVVAVKHAHRYHALAAERAARLQHLSAGGSSGLVGSLVDGVAERFSTRAMVDKSPTLPGAKVQRAANAEQSTDRSAELLKLLLRRASIAGGDESASEDGSTDVSEDNL
jgi:hypothetical protein